VLGGLFEVDPHTDASSVKVNVLPSERQQFVTPHSGCQRHCGDHVQPLAFERSKGGLGFGRLQDHDLFPGNTGRGHGRGGVVLHDIPLLRLIEGAVRDPMDVANRAGSQAAA
jgi:hypothetical protein